MNCIIIDDEETARMIIQQLCSQVDELNVIEDFPNAIQAIKFLNKEEVDLIFLDIHMPDFTGFDFIDTLKNPPKIILTTSDKNFALEAFEYECIVDYLVKPITLPRFLKAIQKAESATTVTTTEASAETSTELPSNTSSSEENELYINIDRRLIKINIPTINLIEAKGDYVLIKTEKQNYTVHSTLKKVEEKLPTDLFLKVHRSYIINIKKIIDIEDNSVLIAKDVIPVSRSNRPELMKRLNML
ncbi:DNA-binding LytR/AlgR family response regulator [Aquimarina sp. EL_43]|uniref:LytR/AlgR family response regulator transcription factor n=1 Tax=Aquimarina TaxID=290174 RepID=UPI00046F549E|nr:MULTISPECIES: LytTR family DNA-binding domain-containing protein [Aquimarina]MBG6130174.1 DNA-binding LytR/AlgR family response regulator [Aquimarina sp. EL_35]MBG6148954.1 DNA-binding LytR/AlgR family response regulator [Aquimarina sp. EL_32]MBG6168672.1 DNA-binding LytR/AlgR family response regulator [Aquimarina sp. EL_43]